MTRKKMNTSLTETQREAIRKMARESDDKDGVLTNFDKDLIGYGRVRIDLPLRDTKMMAKHLEVLAAAIDRCRVILSYQHKDERGSILAVKGFLREANKKVNAYRRIRPD